MLYLKKNIHVLLFINLIYGSFDIFVFRIFI
jgi:hypothetical protein